MIKIILKLGLVITSIPLCVTAQKLEKHTITDSSTFSNFTNLLTVDGSYIVKYEAMSSIPLRTVEELIPHLPGMVEQDGQLHMRGSRSDEISYELEDASVRDIMTGENIKLLIPEAMDELRLQSLPISAHLRGAAGGTIKYQMRSGQKQLQSSLILESDEFTSQNKSLFDSYSYGYRDIVGTLSGSIPGLRNHSAFFIAGQYTGYKDQQRVFWDGFEFENLVNSGFGPKDTLDLLTVLPGNIPNSNFGKWTGNASLDLNLGVIKLRGLTALMMQKRQDNQLPIQHLFNGTRIPEEEKSVGLFSLKATHELTNALSYNIRFDYFDTRGKYFDPLLGDNFMLYADSLANSEIGINFSDYGGFPYDSEFYGFPFDETGKLLAEYRKFKQNYWQGHLNLRYQYSAHTIFLGGSFQKYSLRYFNNFTDVDDYNLHRTQLLRLRINPDLLNEMYGSHEFEYGLLTASPFNYFGYDILGNEIDGGLNGRKNPTFSALYIQNHFHTNEMTINIGLRIENYDFDYLKLKNPFNPQYIREPIFTLPVEEFEKSDAKLRLSPRFNLSYQIKPNTILNLQGGVFYQPPRLNYLYFNTMLLSEALYFGGLKEAPMLDIEPLKSTNFELGFSRNISDNFGINITAFQKKTENQLGSALLFRGTNSFNSSDFITQNNEKSNTKGVELLVNLNRVKRISGWLCFSYQKMKGFFSKPDINRNSSDGPGIYSIRTSYPLDYNQTFRGAFDLDWLFVKQDGPILENLGVNILYTFNSGHPYDEIMSSGWGPYPPPVHLAGLSHVYQSVFFNINAQGSPNNARTSFVSEWHLQLSKKINIGKTSITFYTYIQNLFNSKNALHVYENTGIDNDDGFLSNPDWSQSTVANFGQNYVDLYRAINLNNRQHLWELTGKDLYNTPRQIRFGFSVVY